MGNSKVMAWRVPAMLWGFGGQADGDFLRCDRCAWE